MAWAKQASRKLQNWLPTDYTPSPPYPAADIIDWLCYISSGRPPGNERFSIEAAAILGYALSKVSELEIFHSPRKKSTANQTVRPGRNGRVTLYLRWVSGKKFQVLLIDKNKGELSLKLNASVARAFECSCNGIIAKKSSIETNDMSLSVAPFSEGLKKDNPGRVRKWFSQFVDGDFNALQNQNGEYIPIWEFVLLIESDGQIGMATGDHLDSASVRSHLNKERENRENEDELQLYCESDSDSEHCESDSDSKHLDSFHAGDRTDEESTDK